MPQVQTANLGHCLRRTASDSKVWEEGEEDFLSLASPFFGVPAVVYLPVLFALALVFAGAAGSAADAAARLVVFWAHPLVAARPWRVAALAVAGLPGVAAAASRGAGPVVVAAWRPIWSLSTVEQRALEEAGPRWDALQERSRADCRGMVEKRCSGLKGDHQGAPRGGRADGLWVVQCWVALAGRQGDPLGGLAAELCLVLLAWVQLAWFQLASTHLAWPRLVA
jgi:hypothetical protein